MYELNQKQLEAVNFFEGKMLVLAGPGSGKTTVITYRVKALLDKYNIKDNNILVITFTKTAADEMKNRFKNIYGENKVLFSTFHSFFFRIIRRVYDFSVDNILNELQKKIILKQIISKDFNFDFYLGQDFFKDILNEISLVKNEMIDINSYESNICKKNDFKKIFLAYEKYKAKENKIDFDDMLSICYKILSSKKNVLELYKNKYKFILIDEFQDINRVQYECVKLLTDKNLFVVGDDDQSIYKFRGSKPEFLLDFKKNFPDAKIIILDKNYRSTEKIILFSNKVIEQNKNRYKKKTSGSGIIGIEPKILKFNNITDEAKKISSLIKKNPDKINSTAIIFRINIQAESFIKNFMNLNIPYKLKDALPCLYDHWAVKHILAYINLCLDKQDINSLSLIINKPKRFISKDIFIRAAKKSNNNILEYLLKDRSLPIWRRAPIEELLFNLDNLAKKNPYDAIKYIRKIIGYDNFIKEFCSSQNISSKYLFEILNELQEISQNFCELKDFILYTQDFMANIANINKNNNYFSDGVTLTTMHSAKGLEFDTVYLISAIENLIPYEKSKTNSELEEELRLFYVGLTRAKNNLYISIVKNRYELKAEPSRFLKPFIKISNISHNKS